jgi:hypothetical protein
MEVVRLVLKMAHFISWAALFGGVLVLSSATEKRLAASAVWGARLAFVTGLLLIGIKEMLAKSPGGDPVNHMKVGIKLLLGLAVVGMIEASRKKGLSGGMHMGVIAVSLIAIAVAVLWK